MNDEKLIECVRKYEILYNVQHAKYMDNAKKEAAWKNISDQMKRPAVACKQRWQGLRDAFRRSLKKKRKKTCQKNIKKWRYEDEMSFVIPYFSEKKLQDTVDVTSDEDPGIDDEALGGTHVSNDYSSKIEVEVDNADRNNSHFFLTKKAKKSEIHTASAVLMARLLDQSKPEPDELDRFFLTISDTVKKFPPYQQAMAKSQIFSLVSEMELQQFATTPGSTSQYPS